MRHCMFDIDGTLVQSNDADTRYFVQAVEEVCGIKINEDWGRYRHVTDSGILMQVAEENAIHNREEFYREVKQTFIEKLTEALRRRPVSSTPGAKEFLHELQLGADFHVSIATGAWLQSADLKLRSAGLEVNRVAIASADDHFSRVEIMKKARRLVVSSSDYPCTYFGDGEWDRRASAELGYQFVAVGNKVEHPLAISDFSDMESILAAIGEN